MGVQNKWDWAKRKKERKEKIASLMKSAGTCRDRKECLVNDLKYAMMAMKYPGDCPKQSWKPIEILAVLLTVWDEKEHLEFLKKYFPDLETTKQASEDEEKNRVVFDSGKFEVPEELKGQKKRISKN